jgi:hypothetical protein
LSVLTAIIVPVAMGAWSAPQKDAGEPDVGTLGYQPPEVTDVRLSDAVPHQDKSGGNNQSLIALTGARGGGFAAVWRDQRDGLLGLYLARFSADGTLLEPERPTYQAHTARRIDPAVTLCADGSGAVTWTSVAGQGHVAWMRAFDAQGAFQGDERPALPMVEGGPDGGGRGGDKKGDVNCRQPALAALRSGRLALTWTKGDEIQLAEYNARGEASTTPIAVNGGGPAADPGAVLATGSAGELACLWTSKGAPHVSVRGSGAFVTTALGAGAPQGIEPDPSGGFWVLLAVADKPVLRHIGADGKPDRPEIALGSSPVAGLHFAVFDGGIAVLTEAGSGASGAGDKPPARGERAERARPRDAAAKTAGAIQLTLLDARGAPKPDGVLDVTSSAAREPQSPRVASNGAKLLVAWTDKRSGDPDVIGRLVDPNAPAESRLGPERRLNTDEGSSDQIQASIASSGEYALALWLDKRSGGARPYARRVTRSGFDGEEFALPVPQGDAVASWNGGVSRIEAAVRPNGDALVCWKKVEEGAGSIECQIIAKDGKARTAAFDVAAEKKDNLTAPAVTALAGDRGYLVVWAQSQGGGVWSRRVQADGKLAGNARRVSGQASATEENDVAVATLDDGRALCAWTSRTENFTCRARFLDESGEGRGDELEFEQGKFANDGDPAIAPAEGGGFLLAWTSGWPSNPVRDVCVRLYDSHGKPKGPMLNPCKLANEQDFTDVTRLADKSFAVAWEDDISFYDQVYVRRVMPNGKEMGPIMRIDQLETKFVIDRMAPRIAALGDGWAAVFSDRRRSLGVDVRVKVVGPRFDDAPKETPGKNR